MMVVQTYQKMNRQELCKSVQELRFLHLTHLHLSHQEGERWFMDSVTWVTGHGAKRGWRTRVEPSTLTLHEGVGDL